MSLSLTILGCSGTYAGPAGACSGYLLRTDRTSVWVDCGPGTLARLQQHVGLDELDGIVVSHSHPDHWLELPVLHNALRFGAELPERHLPVLWTRHTAELFAAVKGSDPEPTFSPQIVDEHSSARIGDIDLRFSRTDHPVETLAVRADAGGRSLAYSSDTGPGWALSSLGPGIDLAIVEATLDEEDAGTAQHLTGRQAGSQAAEARVASLLLTHVMPAGDPQRRLRAAAEVYDGTIDLARIDEIHQV